MERREKREKEKLNIVASPHEDPYSLLGSTLQRSGVVSHV